MKQQNSFYSIDELNKLGLKKFGKNVLISRKASFYSPERISVGDNVRIDDFCVLSGEIVLGNYIHISAQALLYGQKGINMEDFSGLSPRVTVFSAMDDFSGEYLIGPLIPVELTNVKGGKVTIKKFAHIGAGSIVFPGIIINEGAVIGAMSLVNKDINSWEIAAGIPAGFLKKRKKTILQKVQYLPDESKESTANNE